VCRLIIYFLFFLPYLYYSIKIFFLHIRVAVLSGYPFFGYPVPSPRLAAGYSRSEGTGYPNDRAYPRDRALDPPDPLLAGLPARLPAARRGQSRGLVWLCQPSGEIKLRSTRDRLPRALLRIRRVTRIRNNRKRAGNWLRRFLVIAKINYLSNHNYVILVLIN